MDMLCPIGIVRTWSFFAKVSRWEGSVRTCVYLVSLLYMKQNVCHPHLYTTSSQSYTRTETPYIIRSSPGRTSTRSVSQWRTMRVLLLMVASIGISWAILRSSIKLSKKDKSYSKKLGKDNSRSGHERNHEFAQSALALMPTLDLLPPLIKEGPTKCPKSHTMVPTPAPSTKPTILPTDITRSSSCMTNPTIAPSIGSCDHSSYGYDTKSVTPSVSPSKRQKLKSAGPTPAPSRKQKLKTEIPTRSPTKRRVQSTLAPRETHSTSMPSSTPSTTQSTQNSSIGIISIDQTSESTQKPSIKIMTTTQQTPMTSSVPTDLPSDMPTAAGTSTSDPSAMPTSEPTFDPSSVPSVSPTFVSFSFKPSSVPSLAATRVPSFIPTAATSLHSEIPMERPSNPPSLIPTLKFYPSSFPTSLMVPTHFPTCKRPVMTSPKPSKLPSQKPSKIPSQKPSKLPSQKPSTSPSEIVNSY